MGKRVLVVSTVEGAEDRAPRGTRRRRRRGEGRRPAVRQGVRRGWQRDTSERSSARWRHATAARLPSETVEAIAGEADVDLAIRDALATFAADEIVVVVRPEGRGWGGRARGHAGHLPHGGRHTRPALVASDYASPLVKVLVTGGAGSSARTSSKRLVAAGDEVVVLDKLTYAGNPANLEGVDVELVVGDIADPEAVAKAGEGCEAVVNFAAETHVDRSILDPEVVHPHDVLGTQMLLEWAREPHAARPGLDRRGLRRPRARRRRRRSEDDALRPSSPYRRRRPAATCRCSPTCARTARRVHHARREHLRAEPVPGEAHPALRHERLDGLPLPVYGDGAACASGCTSTTTAPRSSSVLREGAPGEVYNVGGEEHENLEVAPHPRADRRRPPLLRHVEDRAGHDRRYALDDAKLRTLGWAPSTPSARRACARRSSGTARTAPGGSRSSPASTARTTSSSTRRGSAPPSPSFAAGRARPAGGAVISLRGPAPAPSGRAARRRRRSCRARSA